MTTTRSAAAPISIFTAIVMAIALLFGAPNGVSAADATITYNGAPASPATAEVGDELAITAIGGGFDSISRCEIVLAPEGVDQDGNPVTPIVNEPLVVEATDGTCPTITHPFTFAGKFYGRVSATIDGEESGSPATAGYSQDLLVVEVFDPVDPLEAFVVETDRVVTTDAWGRQTVELMLVADVSGGTEPYFFEWAPNYDSFDASETTDEATFSVSYACPFQFHPGSTNIGAVLHVLDSSIPDIQGYDEIFAVTIECPATRIEVNTELTDTNCDSASELVTYTYAMAISPVGPGPYEVISGDIFDLDSQSPTYAEAPLVIEATGEGQWTIVETREIGAELPFTDLSVVPTDFREVISGNTRLSRPVACGASSGAPSSNEPTPQPSPAPVAPAIPDTSMSTVEEARALVEANPMMAIGSLLLLLVLAMTLHRLVRRPGTSKRAAAEVIVAGDGYFHWPSNSARGQAS